MTDDATMIATRGTPGTGLYQAVQGLLWEGAIPTIAEVAGAGIITIRSMAGTETIRSMAGTPTVRII